MRSTEKVDRSLKINKVAEKGIHLIRDLNPLLSRGFMRLHFKKG